MGLLGTLARYLLIVLAVWFLYRLLRRWMTGGRGGSLGGAPGAKGRAAAEVMDVMVQDPQCGIYLPRHEGLRVQTGGGEHFFCSEACRDAYLAGQGGPKTGEQNLGTGPG
jgi:uncharacterized protein